MAGLSDEGGAGAWLALVMKQLGAPNASEIEKFERFVTRTWMGGCRSIRGPTSSAVSQEPVLLRAAASAGRAL